MNVVAKLIELKKDYCKNYPDDKSSSPVLNLCGDSIQRIHKDIISSGLKIRREDYRLFLHGDMPENGYVFSVHFSDGIVLYFDKEQENFFPHDVCFDRNKNLIVPDWFTKHVEMP